MFAKTLEPSLERQPIDLKPEWRGCGRSEPLSLPVKRWLACGRAADGSAPLGAHRPCSQARSLNAKERTVRPSGKAARRHVDMRFATVSFCTKNKQTLRNPAGLGPVCTPRLFGCVLRVIAPSCGLCALEVHRHCRPDREFAHQRYAPASALDRTLGYCQAKAESFDPFAQAAMKPLECPVALFTRQPGPRIRNLHQDDGCGLFQPEDRSASSAHTLPRCR